MSMHTYIGARYVPNFIGTYDATQNYEAMDVVDNGSGTTYIAKKNAPAGTPLTDTDFWFVYGTANGAIINLQNQIDQINNTDLPAMDAKIDEAATYVSPKEYGAVGDGVADDTAALQDCIDNNAYVRLDDTYYITSPIQLHSGLHIIGKGAIYNPLVTTSIQGQNVDDVTIKDITFINGSRDGSYPSTVGNIDINFGTNIIIDSIKDNLNNKPATINLDNCKHFEISNCIIAKSGYCGIMLHGNCHYGIIHDNIVEVDNYTGYPNSYGIGVSFTPRAGGAITDRSNECTYITINNNLVYTSYAFWEGIDCHAGDHITISDNTITGFYAGITLTYGNYPSIDVSTKNSKVSGNFIDGGGTVLDSARPYKVGIMHAGNAASGELNNLISDNHIVDMHAVVGGVDVGYGIFLRGRCANAINNCIQKGTVVGICLNNAGRSIVSGNIFQGLTSYGKCIDFAGLLDIVGIYNNSATRSGNFYYITDATTMSYVRRAGNEITHGYWMDNQSAPTSLTDFVPEYVGATPAGSNYHPDHAIAYAAAPASASPFGWMSTGSAWASMGNLA